jgi:hypothetical protein
MGSHRCLKAGWIALSIGALMVSGVLVASAREEPILSVAGAGRIGPQIPGETIASPSDFGFAVSERGGTFVCSMAGPETGGFFGFQVMLVEGPVGRGTLRIHGRDVTFSGLATIALIPGLNGAAQTVLDGISYSVSARAGNSGTARMVLSIPAFTQTLGGDTGGIVSQGAIGLTGRDRDDER